MGHREEIAVEFGSSGRGAERAADRSLRRSKQGSVPAGGRAAFTLIELLLVVAIALIAAGIAVPLFARSFQGSQLRTAARHIVMSAKYARSMSVLRQQYMAILFDKASGQIEVVSFADRRALAARDNFVNTPVAGEDGKDGKSEVAPAIRSELRKSLPADISIASFTTRTGARSLQDIYWVNYFPNGMAEGFEIELVDKLGKRARLRVDGLSGDAKVEFL
ncbi:MAG: prepilin-type N-terminal cleavage/methylation domain-containing protein [Kiritimatiellae bacterium]|nr:prepilin-type N-terminal cleavage/methylation domain-containing protein [Kiritimatiellia bacterium]MDW8459493.1 prepilin-type N-terminal cleavage/methylation domain-containing protein [Verrucomicrobiota bacterium]